MHNRIRSISPGGRSYVRQKRRGGREGVPDRWQLRFRSSEFTAKPIWKCWCCVVNNVLWRETCWSKNMRADVHGHVSCQAHAVPRRNYRYYTRYANSKNLKSKRQKNADEGSRLRSKCKILNYPQRTWSGYLWCPANSVFKAITKMGAMHIQARWAFSSLRTVLSSKKLSQANVDLLQCVRFWSKESLLQEDDLCPILWVNKKARRQNQWNGQEWTFAIKTIFFNCPIVSVLDWSVFKSYYETSYPKTKSFAQGGCIPEWKLQKVSLLSAFCL